MSADSQLRALGQRLATEQDEFLARNPGPSAFTARVPRRRRRTPWLVAAAAALALSLITAVVVIRSRSLDVTVAGQPEVPGRWIAAPDDAPVPIRFSDGTAVTLAPGGHARVLDVTGRGAHLMLESGRAALDVTPKPRAHWTVSVGPYTVEVKGTRFDLGWSPQDEVLTLTLVEGKVAISGCALGDARMMFAGETLRASCREKDFRIMRTPPANPHTAALPPASPDPSSSPSLEAKAPPAPSSQAPPPRPGGPPPDSWQALARASKFHEAFEVARERGFDAEVDRADVQDLLLLGDAARLSGNPAYALRAYQRARSRAPGTAWAANAAFAMGRVYFDQTGDFAEAARWFATYSSEQGGGPLAREALGRRMEALARAGDRAGASRAAEQYLRQYPKGPHAPLARTLATEGN
jgi:TolA-binding protein